MKSTALKLLAPAPSIGDRVLSPGEDKFTINVTKSTSSGWNAKVVKQTSKGPRTTFISGESHDEILAQVLKQITR